MVAIVAARSLYTSRHPEIRLESLVIYTTTQTHSLGVKAALVLGLQCRSLDVTAEDMFALRGETLRKALEEDKANGKYPFVLGKLRTVCMFHYPDGCPSVNTVATVGTTSSGAIDHLEEIAEVGTRHSLNCKVVFIYLTCPLRAVKDYPSLWIHVDAAWAGITLACPEYRERCQLDYINKIADSFCTNFHKVNCH